MFDWWQNMPIHLDPIVFSFGSFSFRWYAVFFILGWAAAFGYLSRRLRKGGAPFGKEMLWDIATASLAGAIVGGRLGYAFFYEPSLLMHPLSLVSPIDASGRWSGIWGMSFHGALVGVVVVLFFLARRKKFDFWQFADFLVPAVPIALFFGRLGNFFNLELVGRVTEKSWGMHFPGVSGLRHPSQLYEAVFEGVVLFGILFIARGKGLKKGFLSVLFLFSYGIMRFSLEFFREPDAGSAIFLGWMTRGQALSLGMIAVSVAFLGFLRIRNGGILEKRG
jgi:phosphatidylglycerol---prolipoprotein diacylglyceryl transferase